MKITIHEFDEDNRFFKKHGAKFFPYIRRELSKIEEWLDRLATWGIVSRAIRYKSILNYDCIISIGRIAHNGNDLMIQDKCLNPYSEIAKYLGIPFIFISTDNQISAEVAESYSGDNYYILTSPYELQHTLRKLNISSKSKVLLLQLDTDFEYDEEDTLSDVLDSISVVENTLSNWK